MIKANSYQSNKSIYRMAAVSKILVIAMTFISSALINRCLGTALKGEYAYINNWVSIIVPILSWGIGQTYSTYKRKCGTKEVLDTFVTLTIIQALCAFIIGLITYFIGFNKYVYISFLLSSGSILRTNLLYIAAIEDIKKRDFMNIIYKSIYLFIVTIVFLLNIKSLNLMLILLVVDEAITVIGTFIKYKFKIKFTLSKNKEIRIVKIYKLGFISMLMYLMMTLNYNIDVIFLKNMTTSEIVGIYSVAVQLSNMLWLLPDAFKDVMTFKTSKEDSIKEIVLVTKYCLYLAFIILILFIIGGKLFIYIAYGKEFIDSYSVTAILLFGSLSMVLYKIIHPLYIAKGKQWIILKILFAAAIINVILNILLIPRIGMIGSALASVCSYTTCGYVFLIKFCKEYNVRMKEFFKINKEDIKRIKNLLKINKG